ncbi:LytR family transcriptional attenuator [Saccharopolyspora erythraea NRRL 2338]|nr:LCP family protein [Saccharopolyspora erythraea]PFG99288.1 LytR family transcriptional attenuator [Saccharopolyspora erythraea NRRL 2338]
MDDRPRWSGGPQGQPGRPVPPPGAGRGSRAGNGPRNGSDRPAAQPGRAARGAASSGPARRRPPQGAQRDRVAAAHTGAPENAPHDDTWSRDRRRGMGARTFGRVLVALLSVVVLSTTGYAWATLQSLNSGLKTNDVIGKGFNSPDGATDILLVGNDARVDAQGNPLPEEILRELRTTDDGGGDLTDTMILVRIPNGGQRASAMSFPRDTMVKLGQGFGERKLTEAMLHAKNAERVRLQESGAKDPKQIELDAHKAGQKFLIQTIEDISGVSVDHYAEVNLLGFYEITKAVGGVDVCLKDDVDDSEYSGAVFKAGPQTIQGADALAFVRQRHGLINELDRGVRQQVFMSGLARKVLSSGTLSNPAKLSALVSAIQKSIVVDDDLGSDMMGFAQQMQGIAGGNIEFQTIPVHLVGESGQEEVTIKPREIQKFAADLLLDPEERRIKQQAEATAEEQRAGVSVSVYNASGVSGLAASVLEAVTAEGFAQGGSANAQSMPNSVVYSAPGEEAVAQQVADVLGGLPVQPSQNLKSGSVEVYLGKDYNGPGKQNFAGSPAVALDGMRQGPVAPAQQLEQEEPITADGVPCVN